MRSCMEQELFILTSLAKNLLERLLVLRSEREFLNERNSVLRVGGWWVLGFETVKRHESDTTSFLLKHDIEDF